MIIAHTATGPFKTNSYVVGCEKTSQGILIDAAPFSAKKLLDIIQEESLTIVGIYLTHTHFDHFADAAELKEKLKCPLFVHKGDLENLHKPGSDGIPNFLQITPAQEDGLIEEGQIIRFGDLSFTVIHTPGHSPGGVCFYFEREKVLFSGDVLFKGTHGNVNFKGSNAAHMDTSLLRLMELPDDVIVYPGHSSKTTIGAERKWIMN